MIDWQRKRSLTVTCPGLGPQPMPVRLLMLSFMESRYVDSPFWPFAWLVKCNKLICNQCKHNWYRFGLSLNTSDLFNGLSAFVKISHSTSTRANYADRRAVHLCWNASWVRVCLVMQTQGERRQRLRAELLRWHPDKFQAMFGANLKPDDAQQIMSKVNDISQAINTAVKSHWQL